MFNRSHRIRPRTMQGTNAPEIKALCLSSRSISQFPTVLFTMGQSCNHCVQTVRHSISYVLRIILTFSSPSLTLSDFNPPFIETIIESQQTVPGDHAIYTYTQAIYPATYSSYKHSFNFLAYKRYCNCIERIYSYKRRSHFITIFSHIRMGLSLHKHFSS